MKVQQLLRHFLTSQHNVLNSLRLYQKVKAHTFNWSYIKILVCSIAIAWVFVWILSENYEYMVCYSGFDCISGDLLFNLFLLSRSADKEDINLAIEAIEKRVGIDLSILKRGLERFV